MAPAWTSVGSAVALLCVIAWKPLRDRAVALAHSRIFIASLVFLGWVALSTLWSEAPWRHRLGAVFDWRVLLVMLIGIVVFHEAPQKRRLLTIFVVAATLGAVAVFLFQALQYSPFPGRPPGMLLRNYVTQTMTFAAAAIVAAALLLDRRSAQAGRWRVGSGDIAALGAVAILCASIASVSVGRSGALALGTGAVVLAVGMRRDWRAWLLPAVVVFGLASAVVFTTPMRQHFATGIHEFARAAETAEATSIGIRVHMWGGTLALIRERPMLGYGAAGLPTAYERLLSEKHSGWRAQAFADPHNQYLRIAAEGGVVGLALFVVLLAAIVRHATPQPWRSAALSLLGGWCVTSLFNSHFQVFNEGHLLFLLLGVLLAPQDEHERERPGKALL